MIRRCYDPYLLNEHPTYIECLVCEEWHNFQNFAKWYEENYYEIKGERMNLDKDILVKENKIYSPETCIIVPDKINSLFTKRNNDRGKYPIGVSYHETHNILDVHCNKGGEQEYLGRFPLDKPFQAFTAYKNFKESYVKKVADEYKELIPVELYNAMYNYKVDIND